LQARACKWPIDIKVQEWFVHQLAAVHASIASRTRDALHLTLLISVLPCLQLYLNYKLKSVAHLPWRQMTYKFLNTIIDDLFAFVIKMPTLHRLSVFR
jgi:hypothetical protein